MFFKRFILVLSAALIVSCELPLNELPPEPQPFVIDLGGSTACLSSVVPVIETFFEGEAKDAQVSAAWDCLGQSILKFEEFVQGRYQDRFTARELAHFLEQYFLEEGSRVPDVLLTEVFRIKQLFVGGAIDSITRAEMKNLTAVIGDLKKITLEINPYMKVYTFKWTYSRSGNEIQRERDINFFQQANYAIQQAAKDLAVVIGRNGMPYQLDNIVLLLYEVQKFNGSSWTWIPSVEKAMPLVKKLKSTLTGGDEANIAPSEWNRFALLSGRGFIQYLRYYYFIKDAEISNGGIELAYFMSSIDDLFSYIGDMVDGKPGQTLHRSEVLEIFEALDELVPSLKIREEFLIESMKLKVVFFGGGSEVFVKQDFENARLKIKTFQDLTAAFLRYSKVYTMSWKPNEMSPGEARAYLNRATENLIEVGITLGRTMEGAYDLRDLVRLAEEIDYLSQSDDGKSLKEYAQQFVPVVISLKNILFNDNSPIVGKWVNPNRLPSDDWSLFLQLAAHAYGRYLDYDYFLKDRKITEGRGLYFFDGFVDRSVVAINFLIDQKPKKEIAYNELHQLLKTLKDGDFLPAGISLNSWDKLVRILMERVLLPPKDRLSGAIPKGLSKVATKELLSEFRIWAENQNHLEVIYKGVPIGVGKPGTKIVQDLNSFVETEALRELKWIYSNPLALSLDAIGRMYLGRPPLNYRKETSTMINLIRLGVRTMIRSYAMSLDRIKDYSGITEAEAEELFKDVRPIVIEMEMISPENHKFAKNRFRDANLFTAVGNGDELVNFKEGVNLFLLIFSGIKVDNLIFEKVERDCQIQKPSDQKLTWKVNADCVKRVYHSHIPNAFGSMPDFVEFHHSLDSTRFDALFANLLKATDAKVDGAGMVKVEDLGLYAHLVQYIEGLFQLYDSNGDGVLVTTEAMNAYPRYRALLAKVSGLTKENELRGLFAWLLKKGKPPTGLEGIYFKGVWCKMKEEEWKLSANREMLATILGFIAEAMASEESAKVFVIESQ